MPHYFLDTSALAKLYRKEIGSDLARDLAPNSQATTFLKFYTCSGTDDRAHKDHNRGGISEWMEDFRAGQTTEALPSDSRIERNDRSRDV